MVEGSAPARVRCHAVGSCARFRSRLKAMMHGLMSAPCVYSNPQERDLNQDNISVALAELKETLLGNHRIVCNLSASGLTLDCVSILPAQLKPLKHVYALDLSLNHIRATWQQLPVLKSFLDDNVVQYLDLSMNYLPLCRDFARRHRYFRKLQKFWQEVESWFRRKSTDWEQRTRSLDKSWQKVQARGLWICIRAVG